MGKRNSIIVSDIPESEQADFLKFLAGNVDIVNPLDEPRDGIWLFEFKGQYKDGSERFFIWQLPGKINEGKWARHNLIQKAGAFGLCRLWIYTILPPCTKEEIEYIRMLNETRPWSAEIRPDKKEAA